MTQRRHLRLVQPAQLLALDDAIGACSGPVMSYEEIGRVLGLNRYFIEKIERSALAKLRHNRTVREMR